MNAKSQNIPTIYFLREVGFKPRRKWKIGITNDGWRGVTERIESVHKTGGPKFECYTFAHRKDARKLETALLRETKKWAVNGKKFDGYTEVRAGLPVSVVHRIKGQISSGSFMPHFEYCWMMTALLVSFVIIVFCIFERNYG